MHGNSDSKWFVYTKRGDFGAVSARFGIDPVTARILRNRDITDPADIDLFLNGTGRDLFDASLLPDAVPASKCIAEKIRSGKSIRIVGDYDIDGVCAAFILTDGLQNAGARVSTRIPDRIRDGYGINISIVEECSEDRIDTIITCDNGISAREELKRAKELGMTVILTDHHDIRTDENGEEVLPPADFVINAKLKNSRYREKEICGAVTAWKLLELVYQELGLSKDQWYSYLEFAGLATIGDVMKLTGENRLIAKEALEVMTRGPVNPGLKALIDVCGLTGKRVSCYHVGFVIGPCINAAGRLKTAEQALRLFLCQDEKEAWKLAEDLKEVNDRRKHLTKEGLDEAVRQAEEYCVNDSVLCVKLLSLHESMAGIVAGRLKEIFGKPSFVFTGSSEDGILKGSGRSVDAYNMFDSLVKESDLLIKYGGHPMAAGVSVREADFQTLKKRLNDHSGLSKEDLTKKIMIDVPMPMSYVTKELIRDFAKLEPFGSGNPAPLFAEKGVKPLNMKVTGKNRNALKMSLYTRDGMNVKAIMFGEADELLKDIQEKNSINVLYCPEINEYNGLETIQFRIEGYQ